MVPRRLPVLRLQCDNFCYLAASLSDDGYVLVKYDDDEGYVCGDGAFDDDAAQVLCASLGNRDGIFNISISGEIVVGIAIFRQNLTTIIKVK